MTAGGLVTIHGREYPLGLHQEGEKKGKFQRSSRKAGFFQVVQSEKTV